MSKIDVSVSENILSDINKRGEMFGAMIYTKSGLMQFIAYDNEGCVNFVSKEVDNVSLFNRDGDSNCGRNLGSFKINN